MNNSITILYFSKLSEAASAFSNSAYEKVIVLIFLITFNISYHNQFFGFFWLLFSSFYCYYNNDANEIPTSVINNQRKECINRICYSMFMN